MAIIQISKIQHRTGANTDLPQLSEGEFGFATDERKLYIGNDPNIYPPANSSTTTQTEILTEISTLNFARLGGSANTSLNLTAPVENGQLLVADGNVWINAGGTTGGYINLGSISNLAISGGINGYVMSTDGLGNLSWKSAGVVSYDIADVSQSTPAVVTTIEDNEVITGIAVTIIGVGGMIQLPTSGANNTNKFFALRETANTFSLYKDSAYLIPIDSPGFSAATPDTGTATISFYEAGNGSPGGANTNIQFNDGSGLFGGTANLTFNKVNNRLSLNGNANISNVNANFFGPLTGRVGATTPNTGAFTTVTTTSSISAAGNITGANTRINGLISITGNLTAGNIKTIGTANVNDIDVTGNVLGGLKPIGNNVQDLGTPTQRWRDLWLSGNTIYVGDQTISTTEDSVTLSGDTAYANDLVVANIFADQITGTLVTSFQPYITNVGILNGLTVNGPVSFSGTTTLNIPGGFPGYVFTTDGNGITGWSPPVQSLATATGANTQIQYNNDGNFAASNTFTFDSVFSTLTVPNANISTLAVSSLTATSIVSNTLISASNLLVSGNSSVNNLTVTGLLNLQGNFNSGNIIANGSVSANGVVSATNFTTPGIISAGGNINAGNILTPGSVSVGGTLTVGDFSVGNVTATGYLSALGEIKGTNLLGSGVVSVAGNITGANLFTSGRISATGNAVAGNFLTAGGLFASSTIISGNANVGALNSSDSISAVGTITGGNLITNGVLSVNGNAIIGNIATGAVSATGNIAAANISSTGDVSAAGNLFGNNLNITGAFSVAGNIVGGNLATNGSISANGNATITGNISSTGIFSTSGNVTGANVTANGDLLVTGNANVVNLGASGFISATGNLTGSNIRATGVLSVTGTATVGNLNTNGFISAAGNITGNVITANSLSTTGNVSFGNIASTGQISATGNIIGSSILGSGLLSVVGDVFGTNITANGAISASGNISAQNIAASGSLSVTGNITSNNTSNLFNLNVTNAANLGAIANVKIQGGITGQLISTDGNGNLSFTSATGLIPAGANTQVQYNNNGAYGASANFTFDRPTSTLFATNITGTIQTASQPNITSVGTLTGLSVSGTSNVGALNATTISTTGSITGANITSTAQIFVNGNVTSNNTIRTPLLNVTTTANIANLTVSATANLGAPANIKISGGANNWVLTTNGSGNLIWAPQSGAGGLPGGGNYSLQWNDNLTFAGDSNLLYDPTTGELSAPKFAGDGSLLTNLTISGDIIQNGNSNVVVDANSNVRVSITGISNVLVISETGTDITGFLNAIDANLGNAVTANYFIGSGENLSNIQAANITGIIANANFASFAGDVLNANQANITAVGNLINLTVLGNVNSGNANLGNTASANFFIGNGSLLTGLPVQYSNNDVANYLPIYTGELNASNANLGNAATANFFIGSGENLSNIQSGNITGTVANANFAAFAGDVVNATQSNITSVGTLTGLTVDGNANLGNTATANFFVGNGSNLTAITGANVTGTVANANYAAFAGDVVNSAQGNITSVGILDTLSVLGNINAANLNATGSLNATDAVITGNLTVQGNTIYVNVEQLVVEDPLIELGGGPNGAPLTTNDGKDRGTLLHYYSGAPVDAFMGWDNSNSEFAFGSNVTVNNEVVSYNTLGNVRANTFIGTLSGNVTGLYGNTIDLGAPTDGNLTSPGSITIWNTTTKVTDAIDDLNEALENVRNNTFVKSVTFVASPLASGAGTLLTLTITPVGNPNRFDISWGDGTFSNAVSTTTPTHTYANADGTPYTIIVRAFNNAGAGTGSEASLTRPGYVIVYTPNPVVSFGLYNNLTGGAALTGNTLYAIEGTPINLDNDTTNTLMATVAYTVTWGDGSTTDNVAGDSAPGGVAGPRLPHTYANGTSSGTSTIPVQLTLTSHTTCNPVILPVSSSTVLKVYNPNIATPDGLSSKAITFSGSVGTIPFLAAGVTDNSGDTSGYIAGSSVNRTILTTGNIQTVTLSSFAYNGNAGTLTSKLNGITTGTLTLSGVTGSNGSLQVVSVSDYNLLNAAGTAITFAQSIYHPTLYTGFTAKVNQDAAAVSTGINTLQLAHSVTGSTNIVPFVKDSLTVTPTVTVSSATMTETTAGTYLYISGVPYYNTGSPAVSIAGITINNLVGQTYTGAIPFTIAPGTNDESTTGNVIATQTKSYAQLDGAVSFLTGGIPNENTGTVTAYDIGTQTISLAPASTAAVQTVKFTATNVNGTSSAATYTTKKIQVFTAAPSGFVETSIPVTALGSGFSDNAKRIVIAGASGATPAYSSATNYYASLPWTGAQTIAGTDEAVVRWNQLKNFAVDLSASYLPAGPDLATGRSGTQYFRGALRRQVVANIRITITGKISGFYIAAPGTTIDTASTLNGWLDSGIQYAGAGVPGANVAGGGNGSNGCAVTAADRIPIGTVISGTTYTLTLGTQNLSNATGNQLLFSIALAAGDYITSWSFS